MAEIKQNIYQHLRSAKVWLTKAEEAFDKQHDVRAELDLMLAQAELQHVKEANRSGRWRYKYLVFRHGLALTLAMSMVVAAGSAYWWTTKTQLAVPVPLAGQVSLPAEFVAKAAVSAPPVIMPTENNLPIRQLATEAAAPIPSNKVKQAGLTEKPSYQPEQSVPLSGDEMQKLVRAAGKSLRGQ